VSCTFFTFFLQGNIKILVGLASKPRKVRGVDSALPKLRLFANEDILSGRVEDRL